MSRLTQDGIVEPVSRDQILRHERGQGNIHFSCLADHVQDWQPFPVDPYSCYMGDHTYIQSNGYIFEVLCLRCLFFKANGRRGKYGIYIYLVYIIYISPSRTGRFPLGGDPPPVVCQETM